MNGTAQRRAGERGGTSPGPVRRARDVVVAAAITAALTLGLTAELSGTRDPEHALHPATAQVVDQLVASRDCGGIQLMMELSTSQTQGDRAFRTRLEHAGRRLGCTE